jgi:hypothetical protein
VNLVIVGPDLAGGYLYGADPGLREKLDITTLLVSSTMDLAARHGCPTMSMLRGAEPYKDRWRPTGSVNRRILLVRPGSPRGRAYAAAVRVRGVAVRWARARVRAGSPWLRSVRDRLRTAVRSGGQR